jgi:hypothetical protein
VYNEKVDSILLSCLFINHAIEILQQRPPVLKCAYRGCANNAKPKSKYCCDACGISAAKELLERKAHTQNKKKVKALQSNLLSATDAEDIKTLEDIEKKKKELKQRILALEQKEKELDSFIDLAATSSVRSSQVHQSEVLLS